MSVPDAVLRAFVQAKGCRDATRAIQGVQDQLKAAVKDANEATAAVNRFGRVRGIAVLDVNAAKAKAQTAEATKAVARFSSANATATLAVNGTAARREVAAAKSQIDSFNGSKATAHVHVDTHDSARALSGIGSEARKTSGPLAMFVGLAKRAGGAAGGAGGGLGVLAKAMSGMPGGFGRFGAAIAGVLVVLIALIGPLIAVVSALGPLIGLAAGVGAGMVAAAQGFGVLKLALSGVGDALKEQIDGQGKAASAAISSAGAQRAAARAIQAAQDGVRQAAQGVRDASIAVADAARQQARAVAELAPAYTAARRAMTEMREAVTDANLALRGARFAADDARKALAALIAGPSPRALADAHRDITDALRGEAGAARDLADAQRDLNDLMQPASALDLADAQDAVADADRDVTRAQRALTAALADTGAAMASQAISAADWVAAAEAGIEIPGVTFGAGVDPAAAALALADAQNAVGDASRGAARAREALAARESGPSQDEIARARQRVGDAERAVADARRDTADAQRALGALETPASADALARARHELAMAENAVRDAQVDRGRALADLNAAEGRGIARSPEVVAARDAIRDATRAVSDADRGLVESERAVVRASQALSDAHLSAKESAAGAAIAAAALNEKMDKLPASAQAFVRVLAGMKPRLDELRASAANGFFPGATDGLKAAMGSFDNVNRVVAVTARVLGDAARASGALVGSPAFGKDIERIGGNNARVLGTLGEALRHIISAFRHVLVAAGPLTQWLADVANKWALNAAEAAKAGRESGRMAEFFEKTKAVAQRLGSILGHLGSALLGVGKVGSVSGNEILASIDRAAKRFDEWANSAKGRSELAEFFRRSKELAASLVPVLAGITKALGLLALKLLPLTTFFTLIGPLADEAVIAFVAYKIAITAAAIASGIITVATKAWAAAQWLMNAALAANPIGLVVIAIAALVAGLIIAYKKSETFRNIVDGALRAVGAAFTWLWNAAKDVFEWLKSNWPLVLGILTGPIGMAVVAILEFGPQIKAAATGLLDKFVGGVKSAAAAVIGAGSWVVHRLVDGVKAVAGAIADAAGWVKNRVVDGIKAYIAGYVAVGSWVVNRIVDGIKTIGEALASVGGWLKNRVVETVQAAAAGFVAVGGWILNRVIDGFKVVTESLGAVGGWLKNRVGDALTAAKDGFLDVGGKIMGWIVDGLKAGANLLVSFVNKIIDVINKIPGVDIKHIKGFAEGGKYQGGPNGTGRLAAQGLAQGGAFARTGGVVSSPITLMGEEAPRHPEFVIPTNPAYRGRAQMLAAQAADAVGLVRGGTYSAADMAGLASNVRAQNPAIMGAVGMAESGGRPRAVGPQTSGGRGRGLWQIMWPLHAASFPGMDPFEAGDNARMMKSIQGSQGMDAWEAYTNGSYRRFMADGSGGGVVGAISGALSAVGDVLSRGAGPLLSKLPGVGDLPDWLKGTGKYVLDKAGDWIKGKFSALTGGGGPSGGGGSIPPGSSAHEAFMAMQRKAQQMHNMHTPYVYGGGHNAAFAASGNPPGWDCSGAISAIMHAAGLLNAPMSTDGFKQWGVPGEGKQVTIGVRGSTGRQAHMMAKIGSRYFESGSGHGAQWVGGWGRGFDMYRHPPGMAKGGVYGDVMGRVADPELLGWGLRQGGVYGSYAAGTDYVPRTGPYMLHRGEGVTPAAQNGAPLEVHVTFDGLPVELQKLVRVEVKRNGEAIHAEMRAGVS